MSDRDHKRWLYEMIGRYMAVIGKIYEDIMLDMFVEFVEEHTAQEPDEPVVITYGWGNITETGEAWPQDYGMPSQ